MSSFTSVVFVAKLAERSLCFGILLLRYAKTFWLIDLFLRALLGKKKSHLYVMDTLILCTLSFYRVGCAFKLFYRKVF